MSRIILGILLFSIVAYTIGYFMVLFQKPVKEDGTPKTAFEAGSRVLVLMLGIGIIGFLLFAVYTFVTYLLNKN